MRRILVLFLAGILAVPVLVTAHTETRQQGALLADAYGAPLPASSPFVPTLPHSLGWNCDANAYPEFIGGMIETTFCTVAKTAGYDQGSGLKPIAVGGYAPETPYACTLHVTDDEDVDPTLLSVAEWTVKFPDALKHSPVVKAGDEPITGKLPLEWKAGGKKNLVIEVTNSALYEARCVFGPF